MKTITILATRMTGKTSCPEVKYWCMFVDKTSLNGSLLGFQAGDAMHRSGTLPRRDVSEIERGGQQANPSRRDVSGTERGGKLFQPYLFDVVLQITQWNTLIIEVWNKDGLDVSYIGPRGTYSIIMWWATWENVRSIRLQCMWSYSWKPARSYKCLISDSLTMRDLSCYL